MPKFQGTVMIESFWGVFVTGLLLGTPAGITPGPMLVLIIQESLRHGIRSGIKLACVPLISDIPLVLLSGFFFSQVKDINILLIIISFCGSLFLLNLGVKSIRMASIEIPDFKPEPLSLKERVFANFVNPNAHLFWFTVGAPLMIRAFEKDWNLGFAFLFSFYCGLIGTKLLVAIAVGRSRNILQGVFYKRTMQFLGGMLIVLALFLFRDGIQLI